MHLPLWPIFPPVAPQFYQRTHRVRLKNCGTTDKNHLTKSGTERFRKDIKKTRRLVNANPAFFKPERIQKNAILEAAANEFARVPYSAASINQIIKEAEISRGSFYTYFEDKDDLMRYMLRGFRDTLRKKYLIIWKKKTGEELAIFTGAPAN